MVAVSDIYNALSDILCYPEGDFGEQVRRCQKMLNASCPHVHADLGPLVEYLANASLENVEELYTQTFDMNPRCTFDIGWHLFGEDYHRGLFLAKMRREMKRRGGKETNELPDHLTHVLSVMGKMESEEAEDFAVSCVIPAVKKILENLTSENPYRCVFQVIHDLLDSQYGSFLERNGDERPYLNS